ncbi:autotransporter outer membrane beta-barrel domain-containing protein [Magnetovibrio sp.]|uniref:autotransporter outer membrane beta-barrel domain-containing protein n=1 Tax=Magnetovibrio sp. TaxID=2024836 RepID=UPI002F95A2DD
MRIKFLALTAASVLVAGNAFAASAVSDSPALANQLVSVSVTPVASTQTAGIIAGSIGGALGGGITVIPPASPGLAPIGGGGGTIAPAGGVGPQSTLSGNKTVAFFNSRAQSGVAAGGKLKKAGAWVMGGYTTVDGKDVGGEFDGDVSNLVAGFDFMPKDNAVLGVSIAYENVDVTTTFNTGTFKGKGYTLAPYGGIVLKNGVAIDGMIGVSKINYDTTRTNRTITGSFDATRYMGSVNVSKAIKTSKLTLTPKAGIMQVREKQDGYTDSSGVASASSTINLGRASLGGTVAVNAGKFSPYVRAMAEYDYKKGKAADLGNGRTSSNDKFGINAAVGVNAAINDKLSINVEGSSSANMRDNLDVYGVTGRIRYNF